MAAKVSVDAVKALRNATGASVNDCRAALESSGGNEAKAQEYLRKRGAAIAERRQDRAAGQGRIEAYIHHDGRLGAIVEVNCETDFVARTPDFVRFCRDVAMHVAAMSPRYVRAEDLPAAEREKGFDPEAVCLLAQPFVKDPGATVSDLLKAIIAKTGENVVIRRFAKFTLGESVA